MIKYEDIFGNRSLLVSCKCFRRQRFGATFDRFCVNTQKVLWLIHNKLDNSFLFLHKYIFNSFLYFILLDLDLFIYIVLAR